MGKLKTEDISKPAPKNKVSVLFIFSLAAILAVIGVSSWSFFGKQSKHIAPAITASTSIDSSIEVISPSLQATESEEKAAKPDPVSDAGQEPSPVKPKAPALQQPDPIPAPVTKPDTEALVTDNSGIDDGPPVPEGENQGPTSAEIEPLPGSEKLASDAASISDTLPLPPDAPNEQSSAAADKIPNAEESADTTAEMPDSPLTSPFPSSRQFIPDKVDSESTPGSMETTDEEPSKEPTYSEAENIGQPVTPEPTPTLDTAEEKLNPEELVVENEAEDPENSPQKLVTPSLVLPQEEAASDVVPEPSKAIAEPDNTSVGASSTKTSPLPWQTFAAAFDYTDDRPRIAIMISEAGVNAARTREAIKKLPSAITLGFNPYGQNLQELVDLARKAKHEVILQLPMEPMGYPQINPGPQAMRTDLSEEENRLRLDWALSRIAGYAGVTNQMGSKFTADTNRIQPVLSVIKKQGVFYLDSRTASNSVAAEIAGDMDIPVAINNRFLDHKADGDLIDARLAELESIAQRTGSAIGIAYPHSETFRHLSDWAETLNQKGLILAPVSALIKR